MPAKRKKQAGGRYPPVLSIRRLRTMFAEYNPRRISKHDFEELRWSIRTFGYVQLVVCNKRTRAQGWPARSRPTIVGGHQGVRASEEEGLSELPIHWIDVDGPLEKKLNLTLNRVGGEFIAEQVENLLRELREAGDPLDHVGFTDDEVEAYLAGKSRRDSVDLEAARRTLRERFVVPPFSVLDARQGYWRQRKQAWLALGIQSELGRAAMIPGSTVAGAREGTATAPRAAGNYATGRGAGAPGNAGRNASGVYTDGGAELKGRSSFKPAMAHGKNSAIGKMFKPALHLDHEGESNEYVDRGGALLLSSDSGRDPSYYEQKRAAEKRLGRKLSTAEFQRDHYVPNEGATGLSVSGTSVFDPVLCELVYRWFSGPGGRVLDPFAGGSVRGIVAGLLGRNYVGVDLSERQIAANEVQAKRIMGGAAPAAPPKPEPGPPPVHDPTDVTPVQKVEGGVWLKRDDLLDVAGVRGGKVRTCWELAKGAKKGLVTAGSRASPQVNIVAQIASELGVACRVHTPSGKITPELEAAVAAGAELVQHKAGRNPVIIARAREDAKRAGWVEIPFGMECQEAVEQTRRQVRRLPSKAKRIVVAVGSGMTLAGILHGLQDRKRSTPVLGVRVGADPTKRLDRYAPEGWRSMVDLVKAPADYHEASAVTNRWGLEFDPYYEAKALPYVEAGDLFWVVGIRQTAVATPPPAPVAAATWKISKQWARKRVDCTLAGIQKRCGAECCKTDVYWPGRTGSRAPDGCDHLGPEGCELAERDRPVTCLLYPLMFNRSGTLVLHHRLPTKTAPCGENYGRGPMAIEALQGNLATLFGQAEAARIVSEVKAGRDVYVPVSQDLVEAVEREHAWAEADSVPEPRSQFRSAAPPAAAAEPITPTWLVGDARDVDALVPSGLYDLIFTCPPYYDLERYTDDPQDLSVAETYEAFLEGYRAIIERAARRLKKNRFAVIVVGEIRDGDRGTYRGLIPDTIRIAADAGLAFYNEAILVTTHGSLPVRAARAFESSRKLGKTHQNVLVFVKGDWRKAVTELGSVEFGRGEELAPGELEPPVV